MKISCSRMIVLAAVLLFAGLPPAAADGQVSDDENYVKLPVKVIGYVGNWTPETMDTQPEKNACYNWGYARSVAWDYTRMSFVLDFGSAVRVNKVKILDDMIDNQGQAANLHKDNVWLYYSSDNITYRKYEGNIQYVERKGTAEGVYDVIELSGFSIYCRYLKLAHGYEGTRYKFANKNLQKMLQAYVSKDNFAEINRIACGRFRPGKNELRVDLNISDDLLNKTTLRVTLKEPDGRKPAAEKIVDGLPGRSVPVEFTVPELAAGKYELTAEVILKTGEKLSEQSRDVQLYRQIFIDRDFPDTGALTAPEGSLVILNDFRRCRPVNAVSTDKDIRSYGWWLHGYTEAETGDTGLMITAAKYFWMPPIVYRLRLKGWFAVYLGLVRPGEGVEARLTDEKNTTLVTSAVDPEFDRNLPEQNSYIVEKLFKYADLTGQDIIFTQQPERGVFPCSIAYLKLVPLTAEQIALAQKSRGTSRRIIYNDDNSGRFYWPTVTPASQADLRRSINEIYNGADTEILEWDTFSSTVFTYNTNVGDVMDVKWLKGADRPEPWDIRVAELVRRLIKENHTDFLKTAVSEGHRMGVKVFAAYRLCEHFYAGRFYRDRPEFRIVNRDGQPSGYPYGQSYAYPEVRNFVLKVLEEIANKYDVDGICLDFSRTPPFFGYEKPLIDGFQVRYGEDPRKIDPRDKRWLAYKAGYLTDFMRQTRKILDKAAAKKGKRLLISGRFNCQDYFENGLDIETWAKEGLIDIIEPGITLEDAVVDYFPLTPFVKMTRGTKTRVYPSIDTTIVNNAMPGLCNASVGMVMRDCSRFYRDGADGISFFNVKPRLRGVNILGKLGNREKLLLWSEMEDPVRLDIRQIFSAE